MPDFVHLADESGIAPCEEALGALAALGAMGSHAIRIDVWCELQAEMFVESGDTELRAALLPHHGRVP